MNFAGKSRDQQEQDGRALVVNHGGDYVHTYDEPDTSAWKRKRYACRTAAWFTA